MRKSSLYKAKTTEKVMMLKDGKGLFFKSSLIYMSMYGCIIIMLLLKVMFGSECPDGYAAWLVVLLILDIVAIILALVEERCSKIEKIKLKRC